MRCASGPEMREMMDSEVKAVAMESFCVPVMAMATPKVRMGASAEGVFPELRRLAETSRPYP